MAYLAYYFGMAVPDWIFFWCVVLFGYGFLLHYMEKNKMLAKITNDYVKIAISPYTWFCLLWFYEFMECFVIFCDIPLLRRRWITDIQSKTEGFAEQTWMKGAEKELNMGRGLQIMSMFAPIAVLATFGLVVYRAATIWIEGKDFGFAANPVRNQVVQITLLPMVYSVLTFRALLDVWNMFTGDFDGGVHNLCPPPEQDPENAEAPIVYCKDVKWADQKLRFEDLYEDNFQAAHLYQAWAFGHFTLMLLGRVRKSIVRSNKSDEECNQQVSLLYRFTMQGMWCFVAMCLIHSCFEHFYDLFTVLGPHKPAPTAPVVFGAAGTLASAIAMVNMWTFRQQFKTELEDMRANPKILCLMWLISLAFMQEGLMQLVSGRGPSGQGVMGVKVQLVYTSLVCYQSVGIAGFQFFAWQQGEAWLAQTDKPTSYFVPEQNVDQKVEEGSGNVEMGKMSSNKNPSSATKDEAKDEQGKAEKGGSVTAASTGVE